MGQNRPQKGLNKKLNQLNKETVPGINILNPAGSVFM
jgi:hypothetical protein